MLLLCIFARRFSWSRGLCDDYGTAEENLLNNQPFSFFFMRLVHYQKAARRWVRECLLMHDTLETFRLKEEDDYRKEI